MLTNIDLLIVGAGPVGCVIAERAASAGMRSLIVEKRHHVAGNCYDRFHESGLMIHQYGPHYFRTNSKALLDYLSRFTEWIPGRYIVKSWSRGELFPFPINLSTLEQFFNRKLTSEDARALLDSVRSRIEKPANSEEFVLSRVGRELYEAFYLGYTLKQWERHPKDLAPSVCGRIPVRLNRDDRYVDHAYQVTPKHGFTRLFENMIRNERIHVMLQTDYRAIRDQVSPRVATVFCGPIDEYFDHRLGRLPWRSLNFDFRPYTKEFVQPCVQINYPNDFAYTRSVEIKHVTQQEHPHTVVSYEYSVAQGDPYYPVPAEENQKLFESYRELAVEETRRKNVFFAGRLAQYRYMNTDEAIESALATYAEIEKVRPA